ncbi:MmcQ/YjbR family DNA-binding protein [Actinokineospora xionganensis]|uniref:MmcQ/YjbR family DNA-binding protein n=1 Tax=Actinokineospora xionganensis TaxID=2684470 RepID=A0ABR7L3M7_9PSEU|nr:MmcQ/YjbR family DNA-binding protein [Actinokineospora xionganensis]MBC6447290.1 MmcQ/YjbR family DNA-binding protein [Actinokineospora xionganensis]
MPDYADVPEAILAELRAVCLALPDAYEEPAWAGTRWRVRKRTFAHVVTIASGHPPAYARAAADAGPVTVMTFRAPLPEIDALRAMGHPFFKPDWAGNALGIVLSADPDWGEVEELLTESFCIMAPKMLAARVERPRPAD